MVSSRQIQYFLGSVKTGPNDECWEWQGKRDPRQGKHYGHINWSDEQGRRMFWQAHRLSYYLFVGDLIEGLVIRHLCNNPPCCNPFHLAQGTQQENVEDRKARSQPYYTNRMRERVSRGEKHWTKVNPEKWDETQRHIVHPRGRDHPQAKLTEDQVREIRRRSTGRRGEITAMAKEFNVDRTLISLILRRVIWQHVE